jgi:hypothetical protein
MNTEIAMFTKLSSSKGSLTNKNYNGNNFGKKYRRGKRYAQKQEEIRMEKLKKTQRKREKANYDTWRRTEMPEETDMRLEDLHYANFLGDKCGDNGSRYCDSTVNLKFCDKMISTEYTASQEEEDINSQEDNASQEEEDQEEEDQEEEDINSQEDNTSQEEEDKRNHYYYNSYYNNDAETFDEMYEYAKQMRTLIDKGFSEEAATIVIKVFDALDTDGWCEEAKHLKMKLFE